MDITTPEFDFTEYLAAQALTHTKLTRVKVEHAKSAHTVKFYDDNHPNKNYAIILEVTHDAEPEQHRVHITTLEQQPHELGTMHCVRTEHSIPVKKLSVEQLKDGVILACITSNIEKIEAAFAEKEVYW